MIGNQGIDADVAARMDAYRGNPQALMQKYQQNQQLIDLLALQKLKSEKEAAARDMQLKMAQQQGQQGMPPTIAQQREQEVLGLTKNELAQQAGATLGQQQKEQQRALQGIMQAAARPGARQQPNPAMSGIARSPSAGMTRMAGGGIVAFANGGLNEDEEYRKRVEEARNYLARYAPSWYDVNGRSDAQVLEDVKAYQPGGYRAKEGRPPFPERPEAPPMAQPRVSATQEDRMALQPRPVAGGSLEERKAMIPPPITPESQRLSLEEELGEMGAPTPLTPRQQGAMMRQPDWQGPGKGPAGQQAAPPPPGGGPMGLEQLMEQKLAQQLGGETSEQDRRRAMYDMFSAMGGKTSLGAALKGGADQVRQARTTQKEQEAEAMKAAQDLFGVQAQKEIGLKREDVYLQVNQAKSIDDKLKIWTDLFKDQIETLDKALAEDATYMGLKLAADKGDKGAQQRLQEYMRNINQQKNALRKQYQAGIKSIESGMPLSGALDEQAQAQGGTEVAPGWTVEERP